MEGVMIYIVVYKEISLALTLDSAHTKIWLQNLHPNIQGKGFNSLPALYMLALHVVQCLLS
jgi:hypothetical protein